MKEQVEKLREIEKEICESKGSFEFFALFLLEDTTEWDLIISSDWARLDKKAAISYIVEKIRKVFSDKEMLMLSRLIILDKDDTSLEAIHGLVQVEHGLIKLPNSTFFGLVIEHAYLITSKRQVHS